MQQIIKTKKAAVSFHLLQTIPRMIFLIIVLFSVMLLVRQYVVDKLNVQNLQAEVFIDRFLYSPSGIIYYDAELKQYVPGTIDINKFNDEHINSFINYDSPTFISANISLFDLKGNVVKSAAYNKEKYKDWLPIAKTQRTGPGGFKRITKSIIVNYNAGKNSGILRFDVLQPGN